MLLEAKTQRFVKEPQVFGIKTLLRFDKIFSESFISNNGSMMFCSTYCDVDVGPENIFFRILFVLIFYYDIGF